MPNTAKSEEALDPWGKFLFRGMFLLIPTLIVFFFSSMKGILLFSGVALVVAFLFRYLRNSTAVLLVAVILFYTVPPLTWTNIDEYLDVDMSEFVNLIGIGVLDGALVGSTRRDLKRA